MNVAPLAMISLPDMTVLFIVALVIFGPKRLPELGKQLGNAMRELRKMSSEITDMMHDTTGEIHSTFASVHDEVKSAASSVSVSGSRQGAALMSQSAHFASDTGSPTPAEVNHADASSTKDEDAAPPSSSASLESKKEPQASAGVNQ